MNELETRDTDSNASVNYTLTYDPVGNLTDDGQSYKYVYDPFGRMKTVKNQSNTVVAEYSYNGLGHMIKVLEDTDADGDADGSDVTFYPAYDEGWREVARYRSSDTSPLRPSEDVHSPVWTVSGRNHDERMDTAGEGWAACPRNPH